MDALDRLAEAGVLNDADDAVLVEAYRFCERTRNRLYLVRGCAGRLAAAAAGASCSGWPGPSTRRRPSSASSTGASPDAPAPPWSGSSTADDEGLATT